ncbi:MAG: HEAT repeat domain-containing protein [Acidobacteria bacterium]|nr:HEAT repeat domain-containing protein [Acidobacteriota bacterium]
MLLSYPNKAQETAANQNFAGLIDELKSSGSNPSNIAKLVGIGDKSEAVVRQMVDLLGDRDKDVCRFKKPEGTPDDSAPQPPDTESLKDSDIHICRIFVTALGKIGDKAGAPAVDALINVLHNSKDKYARAMAATSLGEIGDKAGPAVHTLANALDDLVEDDEYVRRQAATALGEIADQEEAILGPLADALDDRAGHVRSDAAKSLVKISNRLASQKATGFSDRIIEVAARMQNSSFPEVKSHAGKVQRAGDLLTSLLWWEQLSKAFRANPALSLTLVVYPLLLLVWLALLWLFPLSLLRVNETLARLSDFKLPDWLGGFNVAPRYLLVAGFFHYHPRVLDAWVRKYRSVASKAFSTMPTVEGRDVHVPLPVVIGKETVDDLSPDKLRPMFSGSFVCLRIWGEAGAGKTSLACRLAKWAMLGQKEARLCPGHAMLPVLIEQDLATQGSEKEHPLFKAISLQLKMMIDEPDPPPARLLRQLLRKRRVLVIIDGLSEMSESSRERLLAGITDLPVNAVVATSRTDKPLDGILTTAIKPERVRGNRLATFMETYLTSRGKRDLFDDDEFFEACRRLSLIVGDRDITALLAKLYAEQMIAVKKGAADADAPENIPELMLSYLNDLCRGAGPGDPDIRAVHRAAQVIAWECLRRTLRPTPADRQEVLNALGGEINGLPLVTYLEERLRVLQTVGAGRDHIRFALDPLAEYLAGMHLVYENGEDEQAWRYFLARIDEQGGELEDIKAFLLAVRDCCFAKGEIVQGLRVVADELSKRAGISAEETSQYRVERRVRQLMTRMKYPEARDRINVAEELGSIGALAKIAVKDLCALLRDRDMRVSKSAAIALGRIGGKAKGAVPHLIEALKVPDQSVRRTAAYVLGQIGEGAREAVLPQLTEALKAPDEEVRVGAAIALAWIKEGAKEVIS